MCFQTSPSNHLVPIWTTYIFNSTQHTQSSRYTVKHKTSSVKKVIKWVTPAIKVWHAVIWECIWINAFSKSRELEAEFHKSSVWVLGSVDFKQAMKIGQVQNISPGTEEIIDKLRKYCCKKARRIEDLSKGFWILKETKVQISLFSISQNPCFYPEHLLVVGFQLKNKARCLQLWKLYRILHVNFSAWLKPGFLLYCIVWEQLLKNMFISFVLHYEAALALDSSFVVQHQAHFSRCVA